MKKYLLLITILASLTSFAQTKKELQDKIKEQSYTTSVGWVIHRGDTVQLGVGSMPNHMYAFIYRSPINAMKMIAAFSGSSTGVHESSDDSYNKVYLRSDQARQMIIKEFFINGTKRGGYTVMAKVGVGDMSNYWVEVENAAQTAEILAPGAYGIAMKNANIREPNTVVAAPVSIADEIKKLKDLMDSGAITKEEFDAQKKKLLNN